MNIQSPSTACRKCSSPIPRAFELFLNTLITEDGDGDILWAVARCPSCAAPIVETLYRFSKEDNAGEGELNVATVDEAVLIEAQDCMSGCEHCAENAVITFDYLLDAVTGYDPATEYLMRRPAICPRCCSEVTEKTMVVA